MTAQIYMPLGKEEAHDYIRNTSMAMFGGYVEHQANGAYIDQLTRKPTFVGLIVYTIMDGENDVLESIAIEAAKMADLEFITWTDFSGKLHQEVLKTYHSSMEI